MIDEGGQVTRAAMRSAKECMQQFNQNVSVDISRRTISAVSRGCMEKMETLSHDLVTKDQRRETGDLLCEMGMAKSFLRYSNMFREDGSVLECDIKCLNIMRRVLWSFTDASAKLRIECGKSGMLREATFQLSSLQFASQDPESVLSSLAILHNCAREKGNLYYFNESKTIEALHRYARQQGCDLTKMFAVLALSYVVNDGDKAVIGESAIYLILQYLGKAIYSSDHQFNGFCVEELVDGLLRLATNDSNKLLILEPNWRALDIFAHLMENGSEKEKNASVEMVWAVAFAEKSKISSHFKIMRLLQEFRGRNEFAETYACVESETFLMPIHKSAGSILRMVSHRVVSDCIPFPTDEEDISKKKHIMLSYSWSSKAVVRKIYERLCQLGYLVWIDEEDMEALIYDSMSKAVENSAVVLMCVSQKYEQSSFCRMEATYAQERGVPIIPIHVEQGYKPDGWLGLLQAGRCSYDVSSTEFEKEFQNLVEQIGQRGKDNGDHYRFSSGAYTNQPYLGREETVNHSLKKAVH